MTLNNWSKITIQKYSGKSRLIDCKNQQPLKILNPKTINGTCHIVLSGYGGGMVSGDHIQIKINCKANTTSFIGTQANTRIYEQINNAIAKVEIDAELNEKSFTVIFPDPVVLQKNSRLKQKQSYFLKSDSILLLVDWFNGGRIDIGEQFQFHSYHSEVKIFFENKLKVLDRFLFEPNQHIPTSPANFGTFHSMFSAYLIGDPTNHKLQSLSGELMKFNNLYFSNDEKHLEGGGINHKLTSSVSKVSDGVYLFRAASRSRSDMLPVCKQIMEILKKEEFLGFNPFTRKY